MDNIFNTCFLCLIPTPNLIPLYSKNGEDCNKIKYVLPDLVIFEPGVPQFVCSSCLLTVTSFYAFKKKCMEINYRLVYLMNKQHEQDQQQQQQRQQEEQERQLDQEQQQQQQRLHEQQQQQVDQQQQRQYEQQQQQLNQQEQQHQRQLDQQQQQQHRRQPDQQPQQQQQINNTPALQFPQQSKQNKTTRPELNADTSLLSHNEERLQKNPVNDVINIDENVAPFCHSTAGNNLKLPDNYIESIIERVLNNELNDNILQIPDKFLLSTGHKQTSSNVNNNNVPEHSTPIYSQLYNSNIKSIHESEETNQSKNIETRRTETIFKNVQPTKNNSFEHNICVKENEPPFNNNTNSNENTIQLTRNQKNVEISRTSEIVENFNLFHDSTNDKQPQKEQNIVETGNTAKHLDNKSKCTNLETEGLISTEKHVQKNSFVDDIEVIENVDSFCDQQLTDKQLKQKIIYQNEITCVNPKSENSVLKRLLLSKKEHSKKNNMNIIEDLIETIYAEPISKNKLLCSNEEYISRNLIDNIEVKENFDLFRDQELTNQQKHIETRKLKEIFDNELKYSKLDIEDCILLSDEHSETDEIDVKENSILSSAQQLTNKQKYTETRRLEQIFENELKSSETEIKHSTTEHSNKNSMQGNNNVKEIPGFHIQQLTNKQHFGAKKIKSEDYLSLEENSVVDNNIQLDFGSFDAKQLIGGQKNLEIINTEADKLNLSSIKQENIIVDENDEKSNFSSSHTPQLLNERKDCGTNNEEIEDSNSLPHEDTSTADFEVKEEFVPYYSSDSKFYQELVSSINSESTTDNSELSATSTATNTPINNFYNNFHNKPDNKNNLSPMNRDTVTCPICAEELSAASMQDHLKIHVNKNHFDKSKCTYCSKELLTGMLPRHLKSHEKKKEKAKCSICNKELLKWSMPRHLDMHADIRNFECNLCHRFFRRESHVAIHKKSIHVVTVPKTPRTYDQKYKCDICNKKYTYEANYKDHLKMHSEESKDWKFECNICKKKFYFKEGYKTHMVFHTGIKRVECTICNRKFLYECQLRQHLRSHITKKRTRIWKCPYCDKTFVRQANMSQHRKIHIGIKKYECKICNMKFLHNSHLKQHENTHTGPKKKKFKCKVCKKAFLYSGTLKKHVKTHDDDDDSDSE